MDKNAETALTSMGYRPMRRAAGDSTREAWGKPVGTSLFFVLVSTDALEFHCYFKSADQNDRPLVWESATVKLSELDRWCSSIGPDTTWAGTLGWIKHVERYYSRVGVGSEASHFEFLDCVDKAELEL